jgi:hypothetical protein
LLNPPNWAKLKLGVSLTLDKCWGQRQGQRQTKRVFHLHVASMTGDF